MTKEQLNEALDEVKDFLSALLDGSHEEAIDLLMNNGEDIEEMFIKAIKAVKEL